MMAMAVVLSVFTSCKSEEDDDEDFAQKIDKSMVLGTWELTHEISIDIRTGETDELDSSIGAQLVFNAEGRYAQVGGPSMGYLNPNLPPLYSGKWMVLDNKIILTPYSTPHDFDLQISKDKMIWEGFSDIPSYKVKTTFKKISDSTSIDTIG